MTKTGFPRLRYCLLKLARPTRTAITLVSIGLVLFLGRDWLRTFGPSRHFLRRATASLLTVLLAAYPATAAAAAIGLALSLWAFARAKLPADSRARWLQIGSAARWSLLCGTTLLSIGIAEAVAGAWLAWSHRLPALPATFVEQAGREKEVLIVVIGESSALGVPYEDWLSVGAVVGRELTHAIPSRQFRVEILAEKGATLETMHLKLARLTHRPDALIVYCGHNEFLARFSLSNRVLYYDDERSRAWGRAWLESLGRLSAVARLARENLEKQRVGLTPAQSFGGFQATIGRPVCALEDTGQVYDDFGRRLESIVANCERIGCLPILIIPPGNDASDPSQSYALPGLRTQARRALFEQLTQIRSHEEGNPSAAISAYREILTVQPVHAQTHHRLARLLESEGSFALANRHYILARDHDGLPMRASTRLESIYHAVAQRHERSVVLVDGPAVLRARSQNGILDNHLFHDNVHPSLKAQLALAEAVLAGLKARGVFGWPREMAAIRIEPARIVVEFQVDASAWATVCSRTAAHYGQLAFLTVESAERIQWRDRYSQAARRIMAGATPENAGIPGLGTQE
jgi:hypothetical protein